MLAEPDADVVSGVADPGALPGENSGAATSNTQKHSGAPAVDAVTAAQRALDEFSVLMYTYVGVVQRDAPPSSRAPDDAEEVAGDEASRRELAARAPEYAKDLLRANGDVANAVRRIREEVDDDIAEQRDALVCAERSSVAAGKELQDESGKVNTLLELVRSAICQTEQENF